VEVESSEKHLVTNETKLWLLRNDLRCYFARYITLHILGLLSTGRYARDRTRSLLFVLICALPFQWRSVLRDLLDSSRNYCASFACFLRLILHLSYDKSFKHIDWLRDSNFLILQKLSILQPINMFKKFVVRQM